MNILTKSKSSLTFIVTIAIFAVIGVIFILLNQMTKHNPSQTALLETNYDNTQSDFRNVSYYGQEPVMPETMSIFQLQQQLDPGLAEKIANILNISAIESEQGFWANDRWSLVYDHTENLIMLSSNTPYSTAGQINEDIALESALEWFTKLSLPKNIELNKNKTEFFEGEYELKPSSPQRAGLIQLQFGFTLESVPVYSDKNPQSPYVITLDTRYELTKLIIYPQQVIDFQPTSEHPTLTIDQALNNISQQNWASIIEVKNDLSTHDLTQVIKLELTNARVEYRIDSQTQQALPYYRFEGKATLSNQEHVEIELISPAIEL